MSVLVNTSEGQLPREELTPRDSVQENDTARMVVTEWYYRGRCVRRDAWANMLRGESVQAETH